MRSQNVAVGHLAKGGRLGRTFRTHLKQLIEEAGSQRAFARRLHEGNASRSDYSPRVNGWLKGRDLPSFDGLHLIAQKFDVSIDWLAGYDVPRHREARAKIGTTAEALRELVSERNPGGFDPRLVQPDPERFIALVVDEWWQLQLERRAKVAADQFRELANMIEREARRVSDASARHEAQYVANQCRWQSSKLESPSVTWDDINDLRFPSVARQSRWSESGRLETDFKVVLGWAFLWRLPQHDIAIYLEPGTELATIAGVHVRRGTRRAPRFLIKNEPDAPVDTPKPKRRGQEPK